MKNEHKFGYGIGIGILIGFFICQVTFLNFGVNGLWGLTIFGVCISILALVHILGKTEKTTKTEGVSGPEEKKSLLSKALEWKK